MIKKLHFKTLLLLCTMIMGIGSAWADDQVTLWSEDFSSYSKDAVPSGGTYSYVCTDGNGGGKTKVYNENTAAGTAPELLVAKTNGTFSATITDLKGCTGDLTLTFITNETKLVPSAKVGTTACTVSGTTKKKETSTYTITLPTGATQVTITFTSTSGNSRLDDIVLTGTKVSGGGTSDLTDNDFALSEESVALSFDLYNNANAQVINYTTSSTGAVTIDDNDYATFVIDEENKTITVTPTAVTPSAQTITVNQAADENYKAGTATFTLTITDSTPIPTHTVTFSVNGTTTTQDFEEGVAIVFPENPADIEGKTFVGWTTTAIDGTTDEAPDFVTSATMGDADVTYYAVFAEGESAAASLTKMASTDTFADGDNIVIVANDGEKDYAIYQETVSNSWVGKYEFDGNVSTVSAHDKNWLTVTANESNWKLGDATNGYLYSSSSNNLAFDTNNSSSFTLAYSDGNGFTLKYGSRWLSLRTDTENNTFRLGGTGSTPLGVGYFDIYKYVAGGLTYTAYCTTVVADTKLEPELSFSPDVVNASIGTAFTQPTLNTAAGFNETVEYSSSNENVAQIMDTETGEIRLVAEGTATITATFTGNDDFKAGSASYTLTVTDNRITTTITQENIVLDVSEVATLTQLNPVVKDANDNVIDYEFSEFLSIVSFDQISEDDVISSLDGNTGQITLSGNIGTATLKAYYNRFNENTTYKPSECTFTITVVDLNAPGAVNNPYTISEARAAIDANTGVTGVYATGIVSAIVTEYNSQYENITFDISSDGETSSDQLRAYRCVGTASTDASDVKVGDEVVIYGNMTLYNESIYEFTQGCQLVSLTRPADTTPSITVNPATVDVDADEHNGTLDLDYANLTITDMSDFGIQYYDAEGEETSEPDWIEVLVAEQDPEVGEGYVVSYSMIENDGEARTTYFKVYAMDDETNLVYSNLITITQAEYVAPFVPATYTLATTITSGKHYIISNGENKAMGLQNNNNRAAADVAIANGVATVSSADVYEFVIQGPDANGNYTIYDESNSGYLYAASNSSNQLKNEAALDNNNNGKWSIEFDGNGVATIKAQGSNGRNWMRYNESNDIFSCYGDGQKNIYLYEKDGEAAPTETVHVTAAKYATYCSENALDFSDTGLTAYIAKMNGSNVEFEPVTKVPAYSGVLLKADAAGDFTVNVATTVDDVTDNVFIGVTEETPDVPAGIFVLLNGNDGVGFYKTQNAFTVGAHTAYLPALAGGTARSFIGLNETTGISDVNRETMANNRYFDLQGRSVAQPTKGLYIMNGKKVLVK